MSQEYCWACTKSYSRDEVFDIPIFKQGWTVKWCFNCANEQLEWSDYCIVRKPENYKRIQIRSIEEEAEEYTHKMRELFLSYEKQFGKCDEDDAADLWFEFQNIMEHEEDVNNILENKKIYKESSSL